MLNLERVEYIIRELQEKKAVLVNDLSKKYNVSPSTIRRDFSQLEAEGMLRRTYGGAVLIEQHNTEIPYAVRSYENKAAKNTIGKLAASLVKDDMFILLDGTSTTASMIKYLKGKNNLKIVTNSAQASLDCLDILPSAEICCTGGWMNTFNRSFLGTAAQERLTNFTCDFLFFSARSLSMEKGITEVNDEDASMKMQMLKSCRHAIFLCDSSKFDLVSYLHVCDVSKIDCVITNEKPTAHWISFFQREKVRLIYPKSIE